MTLIYAGDGGVDFKSVVFFFLASIRLLCVVMSTCEIMNHTAANVFVTTILVEIICNT
jgi:hypothetical protein